MTTRYRTRSPTQGKTHLSPPYRVRLVPPRPDKRGTFEPWYPLKEGEFSFDGTKAFLLDDTCDKPSDEAHDVSAVTTATRAHPHSGKRSKAADNPDPQPNRTSAVIKAGHADEKLEASKTQTPTKKKRTKDVPKAAREVIFIESDNELKSALSDTAPPGERFYDSDGETSAGGDKKFKLAEEKREHKVESKGKAHTGIVLDEDAVGRDPKLSEADVMSVLESGNACPFCTWRARGDDIAYEQKSRRDQHLLGFVTARSASSKSINALLAYHNESWIIEQIAEGNSIKSRADGRDGWNGCIAQPSGADIDPVSRPFSGSNPSVVLTLGNVEKEELPTVVSLRSKRAGRQSLQHQCT